nr:helicase-related protein [Aquicella siphonis]
MMREVMYRAEKDAPFPYSTQILSVLISLQYPDNLIMQINTGEGKGITTALLAAMQHALGQTVDVCTANKDLAERDYEEHLPFFQMLGIETSMVRAESEPGTYKVGGINYSTVSEMSLYRSRAKLEGEHLRTRDGSKVPVSLILDESDYALLDDKTLFNYATSPESGSDPFENTYAWIYPLVNEFIDSHEFANIDDKTGKVLTDEQDVIALKNFLYEHVTSNKHKILLKDISDRKLDKWINAACSAKQLKEGTDFTVQKIKRKAGEEEIELDAAIPLIDNIPQPGSSYSNGVHQFLHARLQAGKKTARFPIDAEMLFVASESAKNFVDYYNRKDGRIVGISGTVGTLVELKEQNAKFGLEVISIPPHNTNQRQYEPLQVKKTSEAHVQAIRDAVNDAVDEKGDRPPILMICENASEARQLLEKLKLQLEGQNIEFQLVVGDETEAQREEMTKKAGGKNVITISTSLMGRGTNIKPPKDTGLHVIQTYLDTSRTTQQIIGRSARNGMIGKYSAIYDRNNIIHRYNEDLSKLSPNEREARVKAIQKRMGEEAAVERYYVQEMDGIKNVLMKQFGKWNKLLVSLGIDDPALAKSLLAKREELITEIEDRWNKILNDSDPNNEYANPYIRRGSDGRLDHSELDKCLKKFEAEVQIMWQGYRKDLQARIPQQLREEPFNKARIGFLENVDIGNELKARKVTHHRQKRAERKEKRMAVRNLDYALDTDRAYLEFSQPTNDSVYGDPQRDYAVKSCYRQLLLVFRDVLNITGDYSLLTDEDKAKLVEFAKGKVENQTREKLAENVDFAIQLSIKYANASLTASAQSRLYPVLVSLDSVTEIAQKIPGVTVGNLAEYKETRNRFLDQSRKTVVQELLASLAWTQKKNAEYHLERGKVRSAAGEIYRAAHNYVNAKNDSEAKFKALQEVLMRHNGKLDKTFTLSMGHVPVSAVIGTAISRLSEIQSRQKIEKPEMNAPNLLKGAQEQADLKKHVKPLRETVSRILKSLPVLKSKDKKKALKSIQKEIDKMIETNQTLSVFDDVIRYLNKQSNESLKPYVARMIKQTEKCRQNYLAEHPHVSHKNLLKQQEAELRELLRANDWKGKDGDISLSAGHTGFKEFFELRVYPNGSDMFDGLGFTDVNPDSGNSQASILRDMREERKQLVKNNDESNELMIQKKICDRIVSFLDIANSGKPLIPLKLEWHMHIPEELRQTYAKLRELEQLKNFLKDFNKDPSIERLDQLRKENKIHEKLYNVLSRVIENKAIDRFIDKVDVVMQQRASEIKDQAEKIIRKCPSQDKISENQEKIQKLDQQISVLERQEEKSQKKPHLMVKRFENIAELTDFMDKAREKFPQTKSLHVESESMLKVDKFEGPSSIRGSFN